MPFAAPTGPICSAASHTFDCSALPRTHRRVVCSIDCTEDGVASVKLSFTGGAADDASMPHLFDSATRRDSAAERVQAAWRGSSVRKDLETNARWLEQMAYSKFVRTSLMIVRSMGARGGVDHEALCSNATSRTGSSRTLTRPASAAARDPLAEVDEGGGSSQTAAAAESVVSGLADKTYGDVLLWRAARALQHCKPTGENIGVKTVREATQRMGRLRRELSIMSTWVAVTSIAIEKAEDDVDNGERERKSTLKIYEHQVWKQESQKAKPAAGGGGEKRLGIAGIASAQVRGTAVWLESCTTQLATHTRRLRALRHLKVLMEQLTLLVNRERSQLLRCVRVAHVTTRHSLSPP